MRRSRTETRDARMGIYSAAMVWPVHQYLIDTVKAYVYPIAVAAVGKVRRLTCQGCITKNPSQRRHDCLEKTRDYYFSTENERILRCICIPSFYIHLQSACAQRKLNPSLNRLQGIVEVLLHELKNGEDFEERITSEMKILAMVIPDLVSFGDKAVEGWLKLSARNTDWCGLKKSHECADRGFLCGVVNTYGWNSRVPPETPPMGGLPPRQGAWMNWKGFCPTYVGGEIEGDLTCDCGHGNEGGDLVTDGPGCSHGTVVDGAVVPGSLEADAPGVLETDGATPPVLESDGCTPPKERIDADDTIEVDGADAGDLALDGDGADGAVCMMEEEKEEEEEEEEEEEMIVKEKSLRSWQDEVARDDKIRAAAKAAQMLAEYLQPIVPPSIMEKGE